MSPRKKKDTLDNSSSEETLLPDAHGNGQISAQELERIRKEIRPEVEIEVRDRLEDEYKQHDKALVQLINHLFKTEEKYLPELTNVPWSAILPLSIMMMKEHVLDEERTKNQIPLSAIWRIFWMRLRRSGEGEQFAFGVRLAEQQIVASSGEGETLAGIKAT
jgi:hypothetical protein